MELHDRLSTYLEEPPNVSAAAFVAASADIMGSVTLGLDSSVWYQCVLRGDINTIEVGEGTNVQDGTVIHLADDFPCWIGRQTTIGHKAMIHACTIGNECLIGMSSTILDGAVIGNRCVVGAGSLVTKNTSIPDGSLVIGAPAKVVRQLDSDEQGEIRYWADKYIEVARAHNQRTLYNV